MNAQLASSRQPRTVLAIATTLTLLCGLVGPTTAAQLYQWTDEKGVVQYTDKPPVGKSATKIKVKGPAVSGDAEEEEDEEKDGENAEAATDADSKRCAEERERLKILQTNSSVSIRNADGTSTELSKDEMSKEKDLTKASIARFCKS
jgi:Domain of unknown function (DUF4124)